MPIFGCVVTRQKGNSIWSILYQGKGQKGKRDQLYAHIWLSCIKTMGTSVCIYCVKAKEISYMPIFGLYCVKAKGTSSVYSHIRLLC